VRWRREEWGVDEWGVFEERGKRKEKRLSDDRL